MTEMEQLEMNAKIEKAKQQSKEILDFLMTRNLIMKEMSRHSSRALLYEIIFLALSLLTAALNMDLLHFIAFTGWMITIIVRVVVFDNLKTRAKGEFDGAWEVLAILGHVSKDDEPGDKVKKKKRVFSPFKRFKELFERLNSKNKQEAYGSA